MLSNEIEAAQVLVNTDAYQMSLGELTSMYDDELRIDPEFQRLFRWTSGQKSKLIESLLLGIPLPSVFVFEKEDGTWELIDGLQRVSTILEFMGRLKNGDGQMMAPSVLEATKYLPSLHNVVWEKSARVIGLSEDEQLPLDKVQQLAIRRGRIGVEILKRPSDNQAKYDLFQRLNAGGTEANAQELRNCIMIMINREYFRAVKSSADRESFRLVTDVGDDQSQKQRHMELACRFLVHTFIPYDGKLDVEEYIDEGIQELSASDDRTSANQTLNRTFDLLAEVAGSDVLRKYSGGRHAGRIGLVALEGIAVGVGRNIDDILRQENAVDFVKSRIHTFWEQEIVSTFTSSGLRGTSRIQQTVPFGEEWFRP